MHDPDGHQHVQLRHDERAARPTASRSVDGYYLWCEVPRRYFNGSASRGDVSGSMSLCVRAANRGKDTSGESVITS